MRTTAFLITLFFTPPLFAASHLWQAPKGEAPKEKACPRLVSQGAIEGNDGKFRLPHGVGSGMIKGTPVIAVADTDNDRVQLFNGRGDFIRGWTLKGATGNKWSGARGITVDSDGNLWVTITHRGFLQKYDSNGNFLAQYGAPGNGPAGQFQNPVDIAAGPGGLLAICDTSNHRVQIFDSRNGTFRTIGDGALASPHGVTFGPDGNLYVSDSFNDRVVRFPVAGGAGTTVLQFERSEIPYSVAFDPFGLMYVSHYGGHFISVHRPNGEQIYTLGSHGTGAGQFDRPRHITMRGCSLYVADGNNLRIQRFGPPPL